jgi:hypothetical protein
VLGRHDQQSINQARASIIILRRFIDELLAMGTPITIGQACSILRDLYFVAKNRCLGTPAHVQHGVDLVSVMKAFAEDARLDHRWRTLSLGPSIVRIEAKYASYSARRAGQKPKKDQPKE